ncbi:MAG: SurA N-terminal domain-containing protein [Deltaproteobacteria bacterium]|nr:SurA N-terminal domain-containing protein [Deltaproteobacteria bacterium]
MNQLRNLPWNQREFHHRLFAGPLLSLALLVTSSFALPGEAQETSVGELKDRIFAVVDEDPILASDIDRVIALGLAERRVDEQGEPLEDKTTFRRRALDAVIEQRLRFHAVEEIGFERVPPATVEAEVAKLQARFEDEEALGAQLAAVGLDDQSLRQLLTRQLMVLTFIEERLGPRIFIRLEEVQGYYQDVLVPQMEASGEAQIPPMEAVREQIRVVLREQRLNEEILRWTEELRSQADVQLFLDSPPGDLPPVVDVLE